jgi:hypothetical protein
VAASVNTSVQTVSRISNEILPVLFIGERSGVCAAPAAMWFGTEIGAAGGI